MNWNIAKCCPIPIHTITGPCSISQSPTRWCQIRFRAKALRGTLVLDQYIQYLTDIVWLQQPPCIHFQIHDTWWQQSSTKTAELLSTVGRWAHSQSISELVATHKVHKHSCLMCRGGMRWGFDSSFSSPLDSLSNPLFLRELQFCCKQAFCSVIIEGLTGNDIFLSQTWCVCYWKVV